MKKILFFVGCSCLLVACSGPNRALQERLANADSVAINYFSGDGSMDSVVAIKIIRNPQQVGQLVALISAKPVKAENKCGYDGSLHFFKRNQVIQDIDFRMAAGDCRFFSFMQEGSRQSTALSNEAQQLIESFRE